MLRPSVIIWNRWYYPLHWLALLFLGLAIYARTFGFDFIFDDFGFIVNNPYIRNFNDVHYIWKTYPQTRAIGFYSFAFNYLINQLHPQGYHIFNFAIHLLAVGMVWALADVLFKIIKWLPAPDRLTKEFPFVIAVLFLVHPCQTQAVTYISQRFESMATLFYLGSIYSYLCGRMASSMAHKIFLFTCCLCFAVLGIFTKEVAVTIPLTVLAAEFIFFPKKAGFWKIFSVLTVMGFFFFLLFIKLVRTNLNIFFHFHPIASQSHDGDMITAKNYLLTQMRVFLTFIRLLILPVRQNLDYDYPLSRGLLDPPLTLAGVCLIGTAIFAVFKLRKKFPIIAFGLAWILITFSINLAPRANVIFEHKLYLISFGFFLTLAAVLFIFVRCQKRLIGLLITMITVLSLLSFSRIQVWENGLTLWDDTVSKSPHKARPYNYRGIVYANKKDLAQAIFDFTKAIEIDPTKPGYFYNRGEVYAQQGSLDQAIFDFSKAIEIDPKFAAAYDNRSRIYIQQGSFDQALMGFTKAIEINPHDAVAFLDRAILYYHFKEYDRSLADAYKAEELGIPIGPNFIMAIKKASHSP